MDQLITELKRPLSRTPYTLMTIASFLTLGLYPLMRPDFAQAIVLTGLAYFFHFYLVSRRLSDLNKHFLFALLTLVPVLGIIFKIYLCFIEEEEWEVHFTFLSEKLA